MGYDVMVIDIAKRNCRCAWCGEIISTGTPHWKGSTAMGYKSARVHLKCFETKQRIALGIDKPEEVK